MGCFMNILWLMFGGIITAVEYLIASLLMMFTIIGIPFGMQTLKMASLALCLSAKRFVAGNVPTGCPLCADEYSLDILGRHLDLPFALGIRVIAVHHHYRHSVRYPTF